MNGPEELVESRHGSRPYIDSARFRPPAGFQILVIDHQITSDDARVVGFSIRLTVGFPITNARTVTNTVQSGQLPRNVQMFTRLLSSLWDKVGMMVWEICC